VGLGKTINYANLDISKSILTKKPSLFAKCGTFISDLLTADQVEAIISGLLGTQLGHF
jgi:hypothetical protein